MRTYGATKVIDFAVCRMWALNGASEDDIAECREILDSECPGEVYDVYPEDECSKP